MSSNQVDSRKVGPDGRTRETVYQNGLRCVQHGNVWSWYYPGQTRWHYREVVNLVTGEFTQHYQTVEPNAVSGEEPAQD